VTIDRDIVGRVGKGRSGLVAFKQGVISHDFQRAATVQVMRPEDPQVAETGYRRTYRQVERVGAVRCFRFFSRLNKEVDLGGLKHGRLDLEIQRELGQLFEKMNREASTVVSVVLNEPRNPIRIVTDYGM
jgi:hypothetical protein